MKIRIYLPSDYPQIMELWQLTDLSNPARGDNEDIITRTIQMGGILFVLEIDNKIIGTSWITNDGRRLYLHHFGIHPDYQGQGLSKPLLKRSMDFAEETGLQIKLEVHKHNIKAQNLYKNYGFKYLGDYEVHIIRSYDNLYI